MEKSFISAAHDFDLKKEKDVEAARPRDDPECLMMRRSFGLAGILFLLVAWGASAAMPFKRSTASLGAPVFPIPVQELSARQEAVQQILRDPTLVARGPAEKFACKPRQYFFFLEHPDRAVLAWRKLGAKCVAINDKGGGQFSWGDEFGSDLSWETVHHDANMRIWYAHGKVRPAPVLPLVPVELVLVMHHAETPGGAAIEHHADLFLHTDSKTALLFARLMGTSTTKAAEQGLTQLQLFFSALSWYLDQHPDRAQRIMAELQQR
jgi:hypothetical protein